MMVLCVCTVGCSYDLGKVKEPRGDGPDAAVDAAVDAARPDAVQPDLEKKQCTDPKHCDDKLTCTDDTCEASGTCKNTIKSGHCLINKACVKEGQDGSNTCRRCDPKKDAKGWTNTTSTCDDGVACTYNDTCKDGACKGTSYQCTLTCAKTCTGAGPGPGGCKLATGFCLIGGACYKAEQIKAGDACLACDPTVSATQWSKANLARQADKVTSSNALDKKNAPEMMIDGKDQSTSCDYHWVGATDTPDDKHWIQLTWTTPVTIKRLVIHTTDVGAPKCGLSKNSTLAGATITYKKYGGSSFIEEGKTSGEVKSWSYLLKTKTTMEALKLTKLHAPPGGLNPAVFEWQVFCE